MKALFKISKVRWLLVCCLSGIIFGKGPAKQPEFNLQLSCPPINATAKSIHLFVALCDNKYQGIVPVPAKIGNGQDPNSNLYWGCGYGVRTFFKKSTEWKLVRSEKPDSVILERLVFKHVSENVYMIADAYNGKYIKQCTDNFLKATCGNTSHTYSIQNTTIGLDGNAEMLGYIGHDGLMDFQLNEEYTAKDAKKRELIILACYSKHFFSKYLDKSTAQPLVWTTGLMCPEAYTFHDAVGAWVKQENAEAIRSSAARAYAHYQKCGEKAARRLLVTGW